jgi:penicillin-insensitive murein DD-endopeptidase
VNRILCLIVTLVGVAPFCALASESVCYGTPSSGRLENGVQIPESGPNFIPYSFTGVVLGRTYVHSKVNDVLVDAYARLASTAPGKVFMYGESGWRNGGRIRPHRTHQNGLAVDFMVPVIDSEGRSVALPTSALNKFGYAIEFDGKGHYERLAIDFEAIGEHLHALALAGQKNGVAIARVIVEREYLPKLYSTKRGSFIRDRIPFMQGKAWVRHDEHYHVDFSVPCRPMR